MIMQRRYIPSYLTAWIIFLSLCARSKGPSSFVAASDSIADESQEYLLLHEQQDLLLPVEDAYTLESPHSNLRRSQQQEQEQNQRQRQLELELEMEQMDLRLQLERDLKKDNGKNKGGKNNKNDNNNNNNNNNFNTVQNEDFDGSANGFVGFTSFANNNKNKNNNNKNNGGNGNHFADGLMLFNGISETKGCVQWSTITNNQKINPSSAANCVSSGFTGSGCCRSYWWLIEDSGGTSYPSLPCICNQLTRDPAEFLPTRPPVAPTTPMPVTLPPTTTQPTPLPPTTSAPTPTPGPVWTSEPVVVESYTLPPDTEPPTTPQPTPAPTTVPPTTLTPTPLPTPAPTTRAPTVASSVCSVAQNNRFWYENLYPQYKDFTRCVTTNDCANVANACCLAEFCLCGFYAPGMAQQECVPMANGRDFPFGSRTSISSSSGQLLPLNRIP
ncbi:expressed unknown protein [Seminavis robusta]|uniref:Uncharacterized protein n=1 Tax=Seminavis robusta TaxID=568900 RepID=A0A9N8EVU7_9STRA|nr:expressed unknown protein [Seminavis robusta]|eukprot:Sro1973_g308650.1 n/a (442) ;mRNA; f:3615-4940